MNEEEEKYATDFQYGDQFKEDLIHQLWHLVEEIKKLHENLEVINDRLESLGSYVDGLSTEIYKYRRDLDQNSDKPSNTIWT